MTRAGSTMKTLMRQTATTHLRWAAMWARVSAQRGSAKRGQVDRRGMGARGLRVLRGARLWPPGDAEHDHAPDARAMSGADFRNFMETFLRYAEHSWGLVFNYAWSIGMTV